MLFLEDLFLDTACREARFTSRLAFDHTLCHQTPFLLYHHLTHGPS